MTGGYMYEKKLTEHSIDAIACAIAQINLIEEALG